MLRPPAKNTHSLTRSQRTKLLSISVFSKGSVVCSTARNAVFEMGLAGMQAAYPKTNFSINGGAFLCDCTRDVEGGPDLIQEQLSKNRFFVYVI